MFISSFIFRTEMSASAALDRSAASAEDEPPGDAPHAGCPPSCTDLHKGQKCSVCGWSWLRHDGHMCTALPGRRGSFPAPRSPAPRVPNPVVDPRRPFESASSLTLGSTVGSDLAGRSASSTQSNVASVERAAVIPLEQPPDERLHSDHSAFVPEPLEYTTPPTL